MGRSKNGEYKWKANDVVGLYRVIKVLPSEPNVKNLVIYSECLLCHEKVKRFSNRMDSKHRGCTANVKVDKSAETQVIAPLPHTRKDGRKPVVDEKGYVIDEQEPAEDVVADANPLPESDDESEDFVVPDTISLPDEVKEALNFDVDAQAIEMIKLAKGLDTSTNFLFMTTFKRYLTLVHLARRMERKLSTLDDLTVLGSTGSQVANPLVVQYKQVSSESNATAKILLGTVAKMNAKNGDVDPLLDALKG